MAAKTSSSTKIQTNSRRTAADVGFPTGLHIQIDRSGALGIRAQLEAALREAIQQSRLQPGATLPPSRTLAIELGIARSVVVEAYGQLAAEGYLEAFQGSGTRVRRRDVRTPSRAPALTQPAMNMAFTTGLPDPAFFPRKEWLRAYRAAVDESSATALGFPDPQGRVELRVALGDYLARVRSVRSSPEQVVICNGISQALMVVCRALHARGTERIAVEDPCFALHRRLIAACGMQPVSIPVDEHGLVISRVREARVDAVLVAPAHSYPSGAVLSPARRVELAEWATRQDALIVEDDYDAEFRFDRTPVGALQGLAPENVVYAGSVSKVLNPSLRLGWMVAPQRLVRDLIGAKLLYDMATESLGQLALAKFIEAGSLARHIRRVRPRYRARRDLLLLALAKRAPELKLLGAMAGLHLFLPLPNGVRERDVILAAKEDGLRVEGAARHWAEPASAPPAVLVGYGVLGEGTLDADVDALVSAIRGT
jgi:GntR family transcriptional regulator / MocR family aminotransferase